MYSLILVIVDSLPLSQNSYWDCYGSFDEQRLFSVKFKRFRNFFVLNPIWEILESGHIQQFVRY